MKDSNNENDDNNNEDTSKTSDTKLNINSRTLAIYEQYLKKTIQDLTREQDSRLKEDYKLESDSAVSNPNLSSKGASSIQDHEDTISADISHLLESRPTSSFKLLMIGVIGGLILGAVSVFILNITGILPALTERLASLNSSIPVVSTTVETTPAIVSTKAVTTINTTSESIKLPETQIVTHQPQQNSSNTNTVIDNKNISTQDQAINKVVTVNEDQSISIQNGKSVVSYEDFREEAQDTLYQDNK